MEVGPEGGSKESQIELFNAIDHAVMGNDPVFLQEVLASQKILRPYQVAEYMNFRRTEVITLKEEELWRDELKKYLRTFEDQDIPDEEKEIIKNVQAYLRFDDLVKLHEGEEYYDTVDDSEEINQDDNWEEAKFRLDLDEEIIHTIRSLRVFEEAEKLVTPDSQGFIYLSDAVRHITLYSTGPLRSQMRQVLDWYVFLEAEKDCKPDELGRVYFDNATETIEQFGSNEEARARMRSALDKHIYNQALSDLTPDSSGNAYPDEAKELIKYYASTPGRRDAMLRRLGFR